MACTKEEIRFLGDGGGTLLHAKYPVGTSVTVLDRVPNEVQIKTPDGFELWVDENLINEDGSGKPHSWEPVREPSE